MRQVLVKKKEVYSSAGISRTWGDFLPSKTHLNNLNAGEAFIRMERESRAERAGERDVRGSYPSERGACKREGPEGCKSAASAS